MRMRSKRARVTLSRICESAEVEKSPMGGVKGRLMESFQMGVRPDATLVLQPHAHSLTQITFSMIYAMVSKEQTVV